MELDKINYLLGNVAPDKKAAIEAKVEECLKTIEPHFYKVLECPKIEYDLRGHTAGYAQGNVLKLNFDLIHSDHYEDMLQRTVPHEVAHIAQFQLFKGSKPHGREWEAIMSILGLPPERCHNYDTVPARVVPREYNYVCRCGTHRLTSIKHNRILKGTRYRCNTCGDLLVREGE